MDHKWGRLELQLKLVNIQTNSYEFCSGFPEESKHITISKPKSVHEAQSVPYLEPDVSFRLQKPTYAH